MVSLVSKTIKQVNPNVKFGISPVGIWKNNYPDKTGSATTGNESYYAVYADTRTWIRNGWIDYVVPQIYWNIGHSAADYKVLIEWWANEVKGTGVDLYIGQGIYKNEVAKEITAQLDLNKKYPEIKGSMFFTTRDIVNNLENCANSIKEYYAKNPTTPDIESNVGEIVTYDVNLRTKSDYSSEILTVIKVGQKVEIVSVNGDFAKVKFNGKTGYVVSKYVKRINEDTTPDDPKEPETDKPIEKPETPTVTTKKGTVINATTLNVRSGPGTSYSIVTKLKKDDSVTILESKNGWHKISVTGDKTGWVSGDYIKISTNSESSNDNSTSSVTNKTGTVTATVLNVRSGAGTSYSIVTKINKGNKVNIIESKNGWYKIKTSNGKIGWVSGDYIKISTNSESSNDNSTSSVTNKTGTVTATVLNVRSGAGTSYSVVTKINKGNKVDIIESKNGWYKIKTSSGKIGWVSGDYLKIDNSTSVSSSKTKTVTATVLNIRSGAGTNYSIVTKVNKGAKLTILESKNGWSKVKTASGKTGWASNDYLK